jgi:hypothetical protein
LPENVQRLPQKALLFFIGQSGEIEFDGEAIHILKRSWPGKRKKRGEFPRLGSLFLKPEFQSRLREWITRSPVVLKPVFGSRRHAGNRE